MTRRLARPCAHCHRLCSRTTRSLLLPGASRALTCTVGGRGALLHVPTALPLHDPATGAVGHVTHCAHNCFYSETETHTAAMGACHTCARRVCLAGWLQSALRSGRHQRCVLPPLPQPHLIHHDCLLAFACRAHQHIDHTRVNHACQWHIHAAARGRASARQRGGHFLLATI